MLALLLLLLILSSSFMRGGPTAGFAAGLHFGHPSDSVPQVRVGQSDVDVLVYGSSSAAVTASYAAARHNLTVALVFPSFHLGGLSSSGLGATDRGNASTIGGLAALFYLRVGRLYGNSTPVYNFEPHVAEAAFESLLQEVPQQVRQVRGRALLSATVSAQGDASRITRADFIPVDTDGSSSDVLSISASVFIDCSYEGDLMAASGVDFSLGREPRSRFNESLAGVTGDVSANSHAGNQINVAVDPWLIANDSSSGLLPLVDRVWTAADVEGDGDLLVQSFNYRLCFSTNRSNQLPFTAPPHYRPADYTLYSRLVAAANLTAVEPMFNLQPLPHAKLDVNNGGGASTDFFLHNLARRYVLSNSSERAVIAARYRHLTQGLLHFLSSDPSLPAALHKSMRRYGLCADEFIDTDGWPSLLYVREGRRMRGLHTVTQHDVDRTLLPAVTDGVALGSYNMDSHNTQRVAVLDSQRGRWLTRNEGDVQVAPRLGAYPISYSALVPDAGSVSNLLVPVALSASHVGYASVRMEPVFMMLGHAAGVAAALALAGDGPEDDHGSGQQLAVQAVDRQRLRAILLAEGAVLNPAGHRPISSY